MSTEHKSIAKKYNIIFRCASIISLIISVAIIILPQDLITLPLGMLFYIAARAVIVNIIFNNYINPILTKELDPVKFQKIIDELRFSTGAAFEKILAAYHGSDYYTALNICVLKLRESKFSKYKYYYLMYLARIYFELADNKNLKEIYDRFESETATDKKGEAIRTKHTFMRFIKHYLEGEYSSCVEMYESIISKNNFATKSAEIQTKFSYAVACYYAGKVDEANEMFEYIINSAPKMNFAMVARKYLNSSGTVVISEKNIIPDPDFTIKNYSSKISRILNKIMYGSVFVATALIVVLIILNIDTGYKLF